MEIASQRPPQAGPLDDNYILEQIVGISPAIRALREELRRVAPFAVNVLITGPTGTGKEVIARTIHKLSPRREKAFIPVDCAAVTGTLFASHMFGHLKGAFTGATYAALGCFRAAEGGTIFLDEIGEMELALQAKLLRVLQQNTVVPVGGHEEVPIDVRVLAATNRDLADEVRHGKFREDLYYRLNVVQLNPIPLSERTEDIRVFAAYFLEELALRHGSERKRLSADALAALTEYSWPGNVRQLQNLLERLTLLSNSDVITDEDVVGCLGAGRYRPLHDARVFPAAIQASAESHSTNDEPETETEANGPVESDAWFSLEDLERKYIELTLRRTSYNQSAAADLLQMDRSALRRKIDRLGLSLPSMRRGRPRKPR